MYAYGNSAAKGYYGRAILAPSSSRTVAKAAGGNHLALVQWLWGRGFEQDPRLCKKAAAAGHIDILEWTSDNGLSWNKAPEYAARNGQIHVLEWLYEREPLSPSRLSKCAAIAGQVEVLRWLLQDGKYQTDRLYNGSALKAKRNKQSVYEFLLESRRQDEFSWAHKAAAAGNVEYLEWIQQHDFEMPGEHSLVVSATREGRIAVLAWLARKAPLNNPKYCGYAARYGKLDILQWLRKQGCPWDRNVCKGAWQYRRTEVLKWAVLQGCPCPEKLSERVLQYDFPLFKWMQDTGCLISESTKQTEVYKLYCQWAEREQRKQNK